MSSRRLLLRGLYSPPWALLSLALASTVACSPDSPAGTEQIEDTKDWISDNPYHQLTAADLTGAESLRGLSPVTDDIPNVVRVAGDRVYIANRRSGLVVANIADPAQPHVTARLYSACQVFELIVRGTELVLISSCGDGTHVQGLDVSDPTQIIPGPEFIIPAAASDAQLSGDTLYVVAREEPCWADCISNEQTSVAAFNVSSPARLTQLALLNYVDEDYGRHSVSLGDQRLYIASDRAPGGSRVRVIDHSVPGTLTQLKEFNVSGAVTTRWQMSEQQGVLSILSGGPAGYPAPPAAADVHLDTYRVGASSEFTSLTHYIVRSGASLAGGLVDGARVFAGVIGDSYELVTLDIGNPELPQELSALTLDGVPRFFVPHGNRLISLGGASSGALPQRLSLFDITDLSAVSELSHADFGPKPGAFDIADHLHQALQITPPQAGAAGHIYFPVAGAPVEGQCGTPGGGIQGFSWTGDQLEALGLAKVHGSAARGWRQGAQLLTVSDQALQSFSLSDPSAPAETHSEEIAAAVSAFAVRGEAGHYVSYSRVDERYRFDLTSSVEPNPSPPLDGDSTGADIYYPTASHGCDLGSGVQILPGASNTFLLFHGVDFESGPQRMLAIVDVQQQPSLVSQTTLQDSSVGFSIDVNQGRELVARAGSTLGFLSLDYNDQLSGDQINQPEVVVVDASDTSQPQEHRVRLPGWLASTALFSDEQAIYASHYEPLPNDPSRARFYMDRITAQPGSPPDLTPISVPGALLALGPRPGQAVTLDYTRNTQRRERAGCAGLPSDARYIAYPDGNESAGLCYWFTSQVYLLDISAAGARFINSYQLKNGEHPSFVALGDDVLFMQFGRSDNATQLTVLSDLNGETIRRSEVDLPITDLYPNIKALKAQGKRAVVLVNGTLFSVDARQQVPTAERLSSAAAANPSAVLMDDEAVYQVLGSHGVQRLALPPP